MKPSLISDIKRDAGLEGTLSRYMNECALKGPVYAFPQTGSTMEDAHALARQGAAEGTLVFAARQSQGRGRLGRAWESPEGGAYFSIVLRPKRPAADIPQLSLVAGLALAEGIRQLTRLHPSIRWPNDVLMDGKKLAGILIEATGQRSADSVQRIDTTLNATRSTLYAVLGVGINVTTRPEALPNTATSLAELLGPRVLPHQAAGAFWRRFSVWYDTWNRQGFAPIREALRPLMGHFGQVVHVTSGTQRLEGTAQDLDEAGRLVVRLDAGVLRTFEVGEVTLLR